MSHCPAYLTQERYESIKDSIVQSLSNAVSSSEEEIDNFVALFFKRLPKYVKNDDELKTTLTKGTDKHVPEPVSRTAQQQTCQFFIPLMPQIYPIFPCYQNTTGQSTNQANEEYEYEYEYE